MLALQKYLVPACVKLVLVLLVLAPGLILVSVSYSSHGPVLLLIQVMVNDPAAPSLSLGIMYSVVGRHSWTLLFIGAAPACVGSLLVVKLYVVFV